MTEKQKEYIYQIGDEIRMLPGGKNIRVYASSSNIARMQHTVQTQEYRLFVLPKKAGKKKIKATMMKLFEEIKRGVGDEE